MSGGARINLSDAWPISDEEGRSLTGYTFTVENKCEDPVNYIIALESLESTKGLEYLNNEYIKLAIDDEIEKRYGSLDTIDNVVLENDTETIRETREVTSATVQGNSINEHTIRIWLSEDAPLTEQNKVFTSRVRITGGQGVENNNVQPTADSCFTIDEKGEILGYDESCGDSVVIPARVNGTQVKTIDTNAFENEKIVSTYKNQYQEEIESLNTDSAIVALVIDDYKKGDEVDWANLINIFTYAISYTDDTDTNATIEQMAGDRKVYYDNSTTNNAPELEANQLVIYMSDLNGTLVGMQVTEKVTSIIVKSLDLTQATYLETIEASAFSNVPSDVTDLSEYANYEISLTSLTFGKNTNSLSIGTNAFANINVENLEVYTSYVPVDDTSFAKANIGNLTIKATEDNKKISSKILNKVVVNNLVIDEGIEELTEANAVDTGELANAQIDTLTLPTTLNNEQVSGEYLSQCIIQDKSTYSNIDTLIIQTPITEIGDTSFGLSNIKNFLIPETVKTIGSSAFANSKIETINLPEGLTNIGYTAFAYTENLKTIEIPSTVAWLGESAFRESGIETVIFNDSKESPAQLTVIPEYAFYGTKITKITIPFSITKLSKYSFYDRMTKDINITLTGRSDLNGLLLENYWTNDEDYVTFNYAE